MLHNHILESAASEISKPISHVSRPRWLSEHCWPRIGPSKEESGTQRPMMTNFVLQASAAVSPDDSFHFSTCQFPFSPTSTDVQCSNHRFVHPSSSLDESATCRRFTVVFLRCENRMRIEKENILIGIQSVRTFPTFRKSSLILSV